MDPSTIKVRPLETISLEMEVPGDALEFIEVDRLDAVE